MVQDIFKGRQKSFMISRLEIRQKNKNSLDEILGLIRGDLASYNYDQYILYPSKDINNWQELFIERLNRFVQKEENRLLYFFKDRDYCLAGLRFSEWDKKHFGFSIININLFLHHQEYKNDFIEIVAKQIVDYIKESSGKFISIRVNGDDLSAIHAFERSGFNYIEDVIWPVKVINISNVYRAENLRLMDVNDLPEVMRIASKHQYQRGHFHCDEKFDIAKVNAMYAAWVKSAWERKENIAIIEHQGKIAGYFISGIDTTLSKALGYKYGRMKSLALDGAYRGRGYGKKLFEGTCKLLADQGAEIIDSGYSTKNHLSAKLHNQNNFYSVYEEITLHKWL